MKWYWAIQIDPKAPRVRNVRLMGNIMCFTSPQRRAAWCRKSPPKSRRIVLKDQSYEVLWALKGKNRAWGFSEAASLKKGWQRATFFNVRKSRSSRIRNA